MQMIYILIKIITINDIMKKIAIFLIIFSLSACQTPYNSTHISESKDHNQEKISNSLTIKTIKNNVKFTTEPVTVTLNKIFNKKISAQNLKLYNFKLQKNLENSQDKSKISFKSKDNLLKVTIVLNTSFKIINKNLYCREYAQNTEYVNEIIDNISVACRKDPSLWENLVLLTK